MQTIAEKIRLSKQSKLLSLSSPTSTSKKPSSAIVSVDDDEITRLEKELHGFNDSDDSDSDSGSSDSDSASDDDDEDRAKLSSKNIINLSTLNSEYITPLSHASLPLVQATKRKNHSNDDDNNEPQMKKKKVKSDSEENKRKSGLETTVSELLKNYEPRQSTGAIPFYCRVCSHRSSTVEEFDLHRVSEIHVMTIEAENKRTYCKVCRKQFTSVIQMGEHLKGKGHFEIMGKIVDGQRRSQKAMAMAGGGGGGGGRGNGDGFEGRRTQGFINSKRPLNYSPNNANSSSSSNNSNSNNQMKPGGKYLLNGQYSAPRGNYTGVGDRRDPRSYSSSPNPSQSSSSNFSNNNNNTSNNNNNASNAQGKVNLGRGVVICPPTIVRGNSSNGGGGSGNSSRCNSGNNSPVRYDVRS